jgi:hypothetical protein
MREAPEHRARPLAGAIRQVEEPVARVPLNCGVAKESLADDEGFEGQWPDRPLHFTKGALFRATP